MKGVAPFTTSNRVTYLQIKSVGSLIMLGGENEGKDITPFLSESTFKLLSMYIYSI